ncbi:hypothetical protein ACHAXS_005081 [Conticribra weissflogii]
MSDVSPLSSPSSPSNDSPTPSWRYSSSSWQWKHAGWTNVLRPLKTRRRRRQLFGIASVSAMGLWSVGNLSLRDFYSETTAEADDYYWRWRDDGGEMNLDLDLDLDLELTMHRELSRAVLDEEEDEEDFEGFFAPEALESGSDHLLEAGDFHGHFHFQFHNHFHDDDNHDDNRNNKMTSSPLDKLGGSKPILAETAIRPYNLTDVLLAADVFERTFAALVWDPSEDAFVAYYSKRHYWASGGEKLLGAIKQLSFLLRRRFPQRFQKGNGLEFAVAVSSGDYPAVIVDDECARGASSGARGARTVPVLQFGSVFRSKGCFSNLVAMPMPDGHHLTCFEEWARKGRVCKGWRSVEDGGELMFPESVGIPFEELIPQVVWRGTDFGYLGRIFTNLKRPGDDDAIFHDVDDVAIPNAIPKPNRALNALRDLYDDLVPRWQGVVHTAEAAIETPSSTRRRSSSLPWADIKFSHYIERGRKKAASGSERFRKWVEGSLPAAGEPLSAKELARYKYHIDLGGGGTSSDRSRSKCRFFILTASKDLAMPGLLFHHVTPTKDYIHDRLKPWSHYVPVRADLRDLKKKFEWAESHPKVAARIARQATRLAREIGTPEGFAQLFREDLEEPLRRMIEAYRPSGDRHWRRIMEEVDGDLWKPIMMCTGGGIYGERCPRLESTAQFGRRTRAPPRSAVRN